MREREREQCQERYERKMYQTPSQSKRQAIFSLPYYIILDFLRVSPLECGLKAATTSQGKREREGKKKVRRATDGVQERSL